jgi:hypothetical protein
MSVSNDNSNFKPILAPGAVSASAKVSAEASATTSPTTTVDTTAKDENAVSLQSPNPSQPFVKPSKKPRLALSSNTLTQTGLIMDATKGETKAEEASPSGNLFFNVTGDQVLLQMALQQFVKMNKDIRTVNALLSVQDREQQVETREEMKQNVIDRGNALKTQYDEQGKFEIIGGWTNAAAGIVGLVGAKAMASRKVNQANATAIAGGPNAAGVVVPGAPLTADVKAKMMSEAEASFVSVSQQLGGAVSGHFSAKDKFIQSAASVAIALLDAQKTLLEDRQTAIKAAKDLAEQAVNSASIDEFRRSIEKAQESLAVKPFQG